MARIPKIIPRVQPQRTHTLHAHTTICNPLHTTSTYKFIWTVNHDDADWVNRRSALRIKANALRHAVAPFCHHFLGRRAVLFPVC